MKPINILVTALGLLLATPQIRAQEPSSLRFDTAGWNFGDVHEEAGGVSHTFEFTNSAPNPVAIDRVITSCGCTTPDYPRTPVAPGAKGRIKVTLDPRGMPAGGFEKTISVVSGGNKHRNFLTISGNIIPRPRTVEEDFPFDIGGGMRLSTTLLTFRSVAQGRVSMMTVDYVNTSPEAVTLAFERVEGSGLVDIFAPETVCGGCRGVVTFTYDLSERTAYGQVYDVVRPVVGGVPAEKTIYSAMTGIDDFSEVDNASAPRLFLDSQFHDLGEVRRRAVPYTLRQTAANEGAGVLHIRSVDAPEGIWCTLRAGMTIAPGGELPFEVVFYSNRFPAGAVRESVRLVVNDPMRPTREIRIIAKIIKN